MQHNRERTALLYCERVFNPRNFCPGYEAEYWRNVETILSGYREMARSIMNPPRLDVDISVQEEGPLIGLTGSREAIKEALKKILGDFPPPETKIVLPRRRHAYHGSSSVGYSIAKKVVEEMGHKVSAEKGKMGCILRKGFEYRPNA